MNILIREYNQNDLEAMIEIWNQVVEDGIAFPQEELLNNDTGKEFFDLQTSSAVAEDKDTGKVYGLYILHPNNVDVVDISVMPAMLLVKNQEGYI